jgi:SAM-dependent methyltransferase
VTSVLRSKDLSRRFADRKELPLDYGVGMDERVVEYPWLLAQIPAGKVLDAGSALNHSHVLDEVLPMVASLHVVTLAPESVAYPERGVSYVYADMRELPFRDAYFDTIVSISTLEHVGMDTSRWGAVASIDEDEEAALRHAISELKRVLRPGGVLLLTLPYGIAESFGWFRQFDREGINALVETIAPRSATTTVYGYSARGWQLTSLDASADLRYQDSTVDKRRPADLAVAARAVVCLRLVC